MDNSLKIKIFSIVLDCDNPSALANFYAALLGWEDKRDDNPEWSGVSTQGVSPFLLFQQVPDYKPPVWPDEPKEQRQMVHIDFAVNDRERAIQHAICCGATMAVKQYSDRWTVMFDPAGHPFCLVQKET